MIINTSTSSQVNIWNLTFNNEGASTNPSGAQKISLLNGIGNLISDYTPTEFSAGVFYTTIPVSALGNGYYNLIGQSVDGAVTSEVPDALTISNIKGIGDIDKAYVSTYKVITTYTDILGGLTDTTSTKIYLFKDDSIVPVINGVDMTKISTGKYGYDLNISALDEGFYFILFEHIYDGKTYGAGFHTSITNSAASAYNISNTGKPKIFDDNLIIEAVAVEPTGITEAGLPEYIKDNRDETSITLYPDFDDANVIKPDGDMDATTAWTAGAGVSGIAADTTKFIAGNASIKATTSAGTSYALAWTGSAQDLTNNLIGCFALQFATAPTGVITAKLKIADSSAVTAEFSATTDYLNTLINDDGIWYYLMFNMQSFGSVDITDITDITLTIENTVSEAIDFYVDGLRFIPTLHTFEYTFSGDKVINFVQLKGCNSLSYDVSYYDGSYTSIINGVFGVIDYITDYDVTGVTGSKVRLQLNAINYLGGFNVTLSKFNVLSQIYEWVSYVSNYPVLRNEIFKESNWIGANYINKVRKWFECSVKIPGFKKTQQTDLEFVETLHARNTPFYYWLNGGISDAAFQSQGQAWKFDNIYRVYDATETLKEEHYNGQADVINMTVENTIKLADAAYVESV